MTLRRKSLAIFVSTMACSLLIVYSAAEWVLSRGFAGMEHRDACQRLQRFHAALADKARQLDVIAADYAAWDDSWDFVQTRNPTYVRATLLSTSLSTADIDLIAYLDASGNLVFGGRPDPEQAQAAPPPAWFLDQIKADSPLLKHPSESSNIRGLFVSPDGPVLIAARPILKSDRTGPIRGTLIMGRFLGDEVLQNIRDVLIEQPMLQRITSSELTAADGAALAKLLAGQKEVIQAANEDTTEARALVRDIYGRPALLVTLRVAREIHAQSHITLRLMAVCLLVVIAGCGAVTMRLLDHQILARVTTLEEAARSITSSRNAAQRVPADGRDELSRLAHSFNNMLEALQATEQSLRQAKDAAEQANETKSRFLANVSHELRTPLTAIVGCTETILAATQRQGVDEQARTIMGEAESLLALINDLLDHAKIEAGRFELERCPVNLKSLLATVHQLALAQACSKAITVRLECERVPEWVLADPLRLRQVLLNLTSNAVKFTEQGSVTIQAEPWEASGTTRQVRFCVQDTGVGIPLDRQASIFERFTQVDSSTTRRYGGTGLGTTIARQLVTLMGGEIGVQSEVGRGSTFWFVVPMEPCPAPAEPCPREATLDDQVRGGKILLAEDYPSSRKVLALHLERAGYTVTAVEDGAQLLAAAQQPFDLIITDVQMPEVDGWEATRRIRASQGPCRRIPIIALTADSGPTDRQRSCEAGMSGVMTKPVRRDDLLAGVQLWLGATRTAVQAEPEPAGPAPIDLPTAVAEFGNAELVSSLTDCFMGQVAAQIRTMGEALERHDTKSVGRDAHSIKGGAGTLTAMALADRAGRLEQLCEAGSSPDELTAAFHDLTKESDRLREYLSDRTAGTAQTTG